MGIIEGLPADVPISASAISEQLRRRRLGYGRGARMKFEADALRVLTGVVHGRSLGSPIALEIANSEWPKWQEVMSTEEVPPEALADQARAAMLTRPRPGHADFVGMQKYGFDHARPVLERASARETAMRVALGAIAQSLLDELGVHVFSHTVAIGDASASPDAPTPAYADLHAIDENPVRAHDPELSARMIAAIDAAKRSGDTLGGVVEVVVSGLPPGIGSYVHADRRLDARLAGVVMSVQAIKAVEIGDGLKTAARPGSQAHDEFVQNAEGGFMRLTNRAGGIEGGMSTGAPVRVSAAMKPISTVPRALRTVDVSTGEPAKAHHQRSDVCAVPAAGVVVEAMVSLCVLDSILEKFGGDSVAELRRNITGYVSSLAFAAT